MSVQQMGDQCASAQMDAHAYSHAAPCAVPGLTWRKLALGHASKEHEI